MRIIKCWSHISQGTIDFHTASPRGSDRLGDAPDTPEPVLRGSVGASGEFSAQRVGRVLGPHLPAAAAAASRSLEADDAARLREVLRRSRALHSPRSRRSRLRPAVQKPRRST